MRILLINPPNYLGVGTREFGQVIDIYQPLGLAYIAAVLEKAGYEVGIIDAKVEKLSFAAIIKRIEDFKPQIIGLSSSTPDFCVTVSLAKQIKASGDYYLPVLQNVRSLAISLSLTEAPAKVLLPSAFFECYGKLSKAALLQKPVDLRGARKDMKQGFHYSHSINSMNIIRNTVVP